MEPVEPSLEAMTNVSDEVLEENILTNLENETNESEQEPKAEVSKPEQPPPSLKSMKNMPDEVLAENILNNLENESKKSEQLGMDQNGSERVQAIKIEEPLSQVEASTGEPEGEPRPVLAQIVTDSPVNIKKRRREALYAERVFSRDTSLNGLPVSWSMQNIMVRDDDQLRVPIA